MFTLLLGAIGSILEFVGGIGIMNVMLTSVMERQSGNWHSPSNWGQTARLQVAISGGSDYFIASRWRVWDWFRDWGFLFGDMV